MGDPVRVLGDDAVVTALSSAGHDAVGDAAAPPPVVAVGEAGLIAARDATVPVLPVDVSGVPAVDREGAAAALSAVREGSGGASIAIPRLAVEHAGVRVGSAVFDVTLLTDAPARISAFRIAAAGPLADIRADGVVVATPAGSHGYARDAGGVAVAPETDALAVVPVAPFATATDRWIVPVTPVVVDVVRDCPATLVLDDAVAGTVATGESVRIRPDGTLDLLVPPSSRSPFDAGRRGGDGGPREQ
jgi:NAD+ kinase